MIDLFIVVLNFGVLLVWIAISCVTLPLIQWYVRWQAVMLERKEAMEEAPSADTSTDVKPENLV
jgi:hypothetical protein